MAKNRNQQQVLGDNDDSNSNGEVLSARKRVRNPHTCQVILAESVDGEPLVIARVVPPPGVDPRPTMDGISGSVPVAVYSLAFGAEYVYPAPGRLAADGRRRALETALSGLGMSVRS